MNRCRAKFNWCINHTQFRYHNYLESYEAYRAENQVFGQTRSPGNFASAFNTRYDFKGGVVFTKRMSKLCHTIVAKMLHRYLEWVSQRQSC